MPEEPRGAAVELKEKIERFIIETICDDLGLDIDHLEEEEPLIDSGIIDSLGILRILSFIDEELNVDISSAEIRPENFATIKTISLLVQKHMV